MNSSISKDLLPTFERGSRIADHEIRVNRTRKVKAEKVASSRLPGMNRCDGQASVVSSE